MKKFNIYINKLIDAVECAEQEKEKIYKGCGSPWSYEQISSVVLPELSELLSYAKKGKVYFKYGNKQRMLQSTYIITDSIQDLNVTVLGEKLKELQMVYNSI